MKLVTVHIASVVSLVIFIQKESVLLILLVTPVVLNAYQEPKETQTRITVKPALRIVGPV